MNNVLAGIEDEFTIKFNKNVTEGSGKKILKSAPEYLDEIIKSTVATMSETGLEYHGWRRVTLKEEFSKLFTTQDKKTNYDMAVSDLYMIELRFVYRGKPIPKFIYLPYVDRGNLMKISDTYYHIVPVLSDTVVSPSHKEVFVRLLKDKLTFSRTNRNFIVDNEKIPGQVIYSNTYRLAGRQVQDNLGSSVPSIALYLLGMYGIREAFKKYTGIDNVIITTDDDGSEYNKHYKVYQSTRIKPRGIKEYNYHGHGLKIMVPRDKITDDNTSFIDNFVFGIIYTLDLLPEAVDDIVELLHNHDVSSETIFWKLLLGRITFKNGYSVDKMMTEMNDHFNSLQNYMDNLIKEKLREVGVHVDTLFDLMAVILNKYNIWLLNSKEHNSNIDNRYIDILYYILYDIIYGFNRALFDINKKGSKKILSEKEVNTMFLLSISSKKIFNIVKSKKML